MTELLLVLTLIAACAAAGLIGLVLMRERATAREARDELARALMTFSQTISTQMSSIATVQNGQIDGFARQLASLAAANEARLESFRRTLDESLGRVQDQQRLAAKETRDTLEQRLERLQQDNAAKLEQMRQTVDEKLHATLEQRLSESFRQVSERLELVHRGLGEMQSLAAGVGDLKKVLANVKTRGVLGRGPAGFASRADPDAEQYEHNVATRPGSRDRVEFAIRLPGRDAERARSGCRSTRNFRWRITSGCRTRRRRPMRPRWRRQARRSKRACGSRRGPSREKYSRRRPRPTSRLLFLPFEGLYAEVLRRPGPVRAIAARLPRDGRRPDYAGGAAQQPADGLPHARDRAGAPREVWKVLGAVKTEFGKFADVLANTKRQLQTVGQLDRRRPRSARGRSSASSRT